MAETTTLSSKNCSHFAFVVLLVVVVPLAFSFVLYQINEFDSVPYPEHVWSWSDTLSVPKHYGHVLKHQEILGDGLLPGPEDLLYDEESQFLYAGCSDGWIKRVKLTGSSASEAVVENWVHVGGRPLGLAFGPEKELIVANGHLGLLKVTREGAIILLIDEAEGLKFGLCNGVDVAQNGVIYFTDSSYKYDIYTYFLGALEGRPYGRLLSFDPLTNQTKVLVRDLIFPNGVAVSPQQDFVVFCDTMLRGCRKHYIKGEMKGSTNDFVDRLPGYPDNIYYDDEGQLWIALLAGKTKFWALVYKYPWLRKVIAILVKYVNIPNVEKDGGVIVMNNNGEPNSLYIDPSLIRISSSMKIKEYLYYGSMFTNHIKRLNLTHVISNVE